MEVHRYTGFLGGSEGKKYLPTVWETQVPSLDQQDPLEKGMAKYSLENSKDREAWQAVVHGVAKSQI